MASTNVNRPKAFEAKTFAAAQRMLPHSQAKSAAEHEENYEYAKRQCQALYAHDADVEYPDCYQIWYDVCKTAKSLLDKAKAREAEAKLAHEFADKMDKENDPGAEAYFKLLQESHDRESKALKAQVATERTARETEVAAERTAREAAEQKLCEVETRLEKAESRLQDSNETWSRRVQMQVLDAKTQLEDKHNQEIAGLKQEHEREIAALKVQHQEPAETTPKKPTETPRPLVILPKSTDPKEAPADDKDVEPAAKPPGSPKPDSNAWNVVAAKAAPPPGVQPPLYWHEKKDRNGRDYFEPVKPASLHGFNRFAIDVNVRWPTKRYGKGKKRFTEPERPYVEFDDKGESFLSLQHAYMTYHPRLEHPSYKAERKQWLEDHGFRVTCVECVRKGSECDRSWPCSCCQDRGTKCVYGWMDWNPAMADTPCKPHGSHCWAVTSRLYRLFGFMQDAWKVTASFGQDIEKLESKICRPAEPAYNPSEPPVRSWTEEKKGKGRAEE